MVLRVCDELPTLKHTHGGVGRGGVGWSGVGWSGVEWGGVDEGGVGWGGGSYQCLKWMVLRLSGELPKLNMNGVKGLW